MSWLDVAVALLNTLVFPGFLFLFNAGFFFSWVDRKLLARFQERVGPPVFQPWADFFKLLSKEIIIARTAFKATFILAPLISLIAVMLVPLMLPIVTPTPQFTFIGDLIVIVYLLILPALAAMIGGSASGNPYGSIGSSREMMLLTSYELPFIIAVFTVALKAGSLRIVDLVQYQSSNGFLFLTGSGFIAFLVMLLSLQAKLSVPPFDIPDAKTEIIAGPYTEYSGALLALFKLSHAMLLFVLPWFLCTLFFGGVLVDFSSTIRLFVTSAASVLKLLILLIAMSLIRCINPRARIDQALRFFWLHLTIIASVGFGLAVVGW